MSTFLVVNNNSIETQTSASEPYLKVEDGYLQLTTETSVQGAATLSNSTTTYIVVQSAQTTTQTYTTTQSKAANSYSATRYVPVESALSSTYTNTYRRQMVVRRSASGAVTRSYSFWDAVTYKINIQSVAAALITMQDSLTYTYQFSNQTRTVAHSIANMRNTTQMLLWTATKNDSDLFHHQYQGQTLSWANSYNMMQLGVGSSILSESSMSQTAGTYSAWYSTISQDASIYSEFYTDVMYSSTTDGLFLSSQSVTSVTEQVTVTETITI